MKSVGKVILCVLVLYVCCSFVRAEDLLSEQAELFGAETLQDAIPKDT